MPKSIGFVLGMGLLVLVFLVFFGNYYAPSLLGEAIPSVAPAQPLKIDGDASQTTNSPLIKNQFQASFEVGTSTPPLLATPYPPLERAFAEQVRDLNPRGPEIFQGKNTLRMPNPERLINDLITEDSDHLEQMITIKKIDITVPPEHIIHNPTVQDKEKYLTTFKDILTRNQARLIYDGDFQPSDYDIILAVYTDTLAEFKNLSVPQDMIDFHTKEIELITREIDNWTLVRNAEQEPLQAIIALGRFQKDAQEFITLKNNLLAYAHDNTIQFDW